MAQHQHFDTLTVRLCKPNGITSRLLGGAERLRNLELQILASTCAYTAMRSPGPLLFLNRPKRRSHTCKRRPKSQKQP